MPSLPAFARRKVTWFAVLVGLLTAGVCWRWLPPAPRSTLSFTKVPGLLSFSLDFRYVAGFTFKPSQNEPDHFDRQITLWDLNTGRACFTFDYDQEDSPHDRLAITPDNQELVVVDGGLVRFHKIPTGEWTAAPARGMMRRAATFACPRDPSMQDGIISGGTYGGTSYAANAQVFAPLADETINGGAMYPASHPDFTDRAQSVLKLKDGSSNVIIFIHSYALCGSPDTGTIWGYGAGANRPPSPVQGFQPWSRASYLNEVYSAKAGDVIFQNAPDYSMCVPVLPATPHSSALMVALGDGSVRSVVPSISPDTWNKACLPNDGFAMPADW